MKPRKKLVNKLHSLKRCHNWLVVEGKGLLFCKLCGLTKRDPFVFFNDADIDVTDVRPHVSFEEARQLFAALGKPPAI